MHQVSQIIDLPGHFWRESMGLAVDLGGVLEEAKDVVLGDHPLLVDQQRVRTKQRVPLPCKAIAA